MALSPGIPTSFVPKQPVQPTKRAFRAGNNLFLMVSLGVAGIAVLASLGVFAYDKYLTSTLAAKAAALEEAQKRVDENTIEEFVRLRDRLSNGKDLLSNHVILSQFFDTLEELTLANVRFNSMKLIVAGDHTAKIDIEGTARNFNTLAAQSNAFATEKRIKRAIFSGITLTDAKLVKFRLTADIDPKLVVAGNAPVGIPEGDALTLPVTTQIPASTSTPALRPAATSTAATTSRPTTSL